MGSTAQTILLSKTSVYIAQERVKNHWERERGWRRERKGGERARVFTIMFPLPCGYIIFIVSPAKCPSVQYLVMDPPTQPTCRPAGSLGLSVQRRCQGSQATLTDFVIWWFFFWSNWRNWENKYLEKLWTLCSTEILKSCKYCGTTKCYISKNCFQQQNLKTVEILWMPKC